MEVNFGVDTNFYRECTESSIMARLTEPLAVAQIDKARPRQASYKLFDGGGGRSAYAVSIKKFKLLAQCSHDAIQLLRHV